MKNSCAGRSCAGRNSFSCGTRPPGAALSPLVSRPLTGYLFTATAETELGSLLRCRARWRGGLAAWCLAYAPRRLCLSPRSGQTCSGPGHRPIRLCPEGPAGVTPLAWAYGDHLRPGRHAPAGVGPCVPDLACVGNRRGVRQEKPAVRAAALVGHAPGPGATRTERLRRKSF